MNPTPVSLLERVCQPDQQEAWGRFVDLYTPILHVWGRGLGLQDSDLADLLQEVFLVLVRTLPKFHYDRHRSFRAWLRTVTLNKWREIKRRPVLPLAEAGAEALAAVPGPDPTESLIEQEYRQHLAHRALQLMQADFPTTTWKACWECVVAGRSATEVAGELGITVNAVYLAKSRVLRRLHQELDGLVD